MNENKITWEDKQINLIFQKQQGKEYDEALMPHVRLIIKYYNIYDV